jgi:hypothetical protein
MANGAIARHRPNKCILKKEILCAAPARLRAAHSEASSSEPPSMFAIACTAASERGSTYVPPSSDVSWKTKGSVSVSPGLGRLQAGTSIISGSIVAIKPLAKSETISPDGRHSWLHVSPASMLILVIGPSRSPNATASGTLHVLHVRRRLYAGAETCRVLPLAYASSK